MQSKKVKESNLLNLGSKDIRELSFLEEKEKAILPKLLKQLRSDL